MSDRSWFYASNGQQQGPYPEAQPRDLIARGTVRADTLVWSRAWRAGRRRENSGPDGRCSRRKLWGRAEGEAADGRRAVATRSAVARCRSTLAFLEFVWRSLVAAIGIISRHSGALGFGLVHGSWLVPCVSVPGRPNLELRRQCDDHRHPWFFGAVVVAIAISSSTARRSSETIAQFALIGCFSNGLWPTSRRTASRSGSASPERLGLHRLASAGVASVHHHHRLGLGLRGLFALDLPQFPAAPGARSFSSAPGWSSCGGRIVFWIPSASSSSRFRGCFAGTPAGSSSQTRAGRARRHGQRADAL